MPAKSATSPAAKTPPTTNAPTAPADAAPKRSKIDASKITITGVSPVDVANPFARGSSAVPEDHPAVKAFDLSFERKETLQLLTPNPEDLVKLLRKIAAQKNLGVRVNIPAENDRVYFLAKPKRNRKTAEAATN